MKITRLTASRSVLLRGACMVLALGVLTGARTTPSADLVITNAVIWTGEPTQPEAQALAVLGDRIVAIGSNAAMHAWQGKQTHVVDAQGQRLIPGFNDAHVHFSDGGASLDAVQLNDATSADDFKKRIAAYALTRPAGQWITQGEWDETKWPGGALPTRQMIDAITPNNPVALDRYDGHMILVNSRALALAGITAATPDPVGGVIVRDAKGEPTGALKDAAIPLVARIIPALNHDDRRAIILHALSHAASLGVTSVQDMNPGNADIAIYAELLREHKLTTRIYVAPPIESIDDQATLGLGRAFGDVSLRIGAVKAYADGSLGSRTAYLFDPYLDQNDNRGLLSDTFQPLSKGLNYFTRADTAQLQVCTHAIGDAGISTALDLYSKVFSENGVRDRRWRIEHAQHMASKDFQRFKDLQVIASVQPYQAIDDGRWAEERIGADRGSRTYAFKTMMQYGIPMAFGTDWPVSPLNPLLGVYAAVTRATLDGKQPDGWYPAQKLSVSEALHFYTHGSAYAEFEDTRKGTLAPGKLADFILLSSDVLTIAPAEIQHVRVLKTWVGGALVFEASPQY
jgi:predicted amidohydrolase YtcJ